MKESLKSVPIIFYDLIVYYGSSFFLISAICVAFIGYHNCVQFMAKLSTSGVTIGIILLISFCYVYGQLASALSAVIIKKPINYIIRRLKPKSEDDYFFNYFGNCNDFPVLEYTGKSVKKNYWTIIYFIKLIYPSVADDLLKRYARCKLSRVNALNYFFLCILSLSFHFLKKCNHIPNIIPHHMSFFLWAFLFLIISLVFCWEFYQRQCWFGDILVKMFAAVTKALEMGDKKIPPIKIT